MTQKNGDKRVTEAFLAQAGKGRPKGVPNKVTGQLKDMILRALDAAGGEAYLAQQAIDNPGPFMTLVGKVLPLQLTGDKDNPVVIQNKEARDAAVAAAARADS